uniref:F-box domain-containing protein n=1 Tax=Rhodnius prolixus TaxID=13249 RepID=T1IC60_RHOPR
MANLERKAEQLQNNAFLQAKIYHLQDWFMRASWKHKATFITKVISSIKDPGTLKNIIQAYTLNTKDITISTSQATKYGYDVLPNDDDRCLNEEVLKRHMELDLDWIYSLEDTNDKQIILMHFINIGGSKLAKLAVTEARTLNKILEVIRDLEVRYKPQTNTSPPKINLSLKNILTYKNLMKRLQSTDPSILPITNEYKTYSSLPSIKHSKKDSTNSEKHKKKPEGNSDHLNESLKKMRNLQYSWENTIKKLTNMVSTGLSGKKKLVVKDSSGVDALQTLPLWINRKIVKFLDQNSRNNLAKVNRYWKFTIEEVNQETIVRKNLNKVINSMETRLAKSRLLNERQFTTIKKLTKWTRSTKSRNKSRKTKTTGSRFTELLMNYQDDFKESIYKFVPKIPDTDIPFNGLYRDMIIPTSYMYDRAIDCNRKWIAATENTFIIFYNIITGAKTPFLLSGHDQVVTWISFFPKSSRIASASLDRTVSTWDLNNRSLIEKFIHKDLIFSVSVNEDYLVSYAQDEKIRVFKHLQGGTCLKWFRSTFWDPSMVTLSEDNVVYWASIEGHINMLSITEPILDRNIVSAHTNEITYIGKFGQLIVTIGNDNYVRIWNPYFLYDECIIQFQHEVKVNSAVIVCLTLITACADGALRFWHIGTGILFRTIQVNFPEFPMISLKCQEYCNHIKLICNNEFNIYVLDFKKKWFKVSRKCNLYQSIRIHPFSDQQKFVTRDRRLLKLQLGKCTLPESRKFINRKH